MFNQGFRPRFFRAAADGSHAKRVFDLYVKRHRDELLGVWISSIHESWKGRSRSLL